MGNRRKLILSALELFNAEGTRYVSTNHIAKAAGVSPGNLYYHFKNKGEIICQLFIEMTVCCDTVVPKENSTLILSLESLDEMLSKINQVDWDYRFLGREMVELVEHDGQLKTLFLAYQTKRLASIRNSFQTPIDAGLADPIPEEELQRLIEMIWLISVFWNPYLALKGEPVTAERMAESKKMIRILVAPYLKSCISEDGSPLTDPSSSPTPSPKEL